MQTTIPLRTPEASCQHQDRCCQKSRPAPRQTGRALRRVTTRARVRRYLAAIEQELCTILGYHSPASTEFWQMLYYHMGWEQLDQPPAVSSKRLRPLLTVLCAAAAGGDWRLALPFAASVELLHNFSLVHDDIQDISALRRGRAAVWAKWGEAQAINAGDALFTYAHLAVHRAGRLPPAMRLTALALLDQTCIALSIGQHLDMAFAARPTVTVAEYIQMIDGKTACLLATAAEFGALSAGATEDVCRHYRAFARHLGLMFQIRDDVLGIWGAQEATGKPVAADLIQRKKTLPVIYGLQHSAAFRQAFQVASGNPVDVATLTQLLDASGAQRYAEMAVQRHAALALQHLVAAQPQPDKAGEMLRHVTYTLIERAQ